MLFCLSYARQQPTRVLNQTQYSSSTCSGPTLSRWSCSAAGLVARCGPLCAVFVRFSLSLSRFYSLFKSMLLRRVRKNRTFWCPILYRGEKGELRPFFPGDRFSESVGDCLRSEFAFKNVEFRDSAFT